MVLLPECVVCIMKWIYERVNAGGSLGEKQRFSLLDELVDIFKEELSSHKNAAEITNVIIGRLETYVAQSRAYFEQVKRKSNEISREMLQSAKTFLDLASSHDERLARACMLALLSNVAPIGKPDTAFEFREANELIRGRCEEPAINPMGFDAAIKAKKIIYVFDNAGEIGFDTLLIEELKKVGCHVNAIVKDGFFFDDATMEDIRFFGTDNVVDEIFCTTGIFLPQQASGRLAEAYQDCDLVISKGTANYEALKDEGNSKRVMFMLKVKCDLIQEMSGIPTGEFLVDVSDVNNYKF